MLKITKKEIIERLKGPIFSIITPFDKEGNIDFKKLHDYIDYLYLRGARVFYVMTYNSRIGLLSLSETEKLNISCIRKVKKLNPQNIIICGEPYHLNTNSSIQLCNHLFKNGADIMSLIFGEKYYNDQQLYNHFKKINENANGYLLLHQQVIENGISSNPPFINYPIKVLIKIAKLQKFVAMKEDSKLDKYTKLICKECCRYITIITSGNGKTQWLKASKYGCQSWLSGVSNLDPLIAIKFFQFYKSKDFKKIEFIIEKIEKPFFKFKKKFGWHLTIKGYLEEFKFFKRYERMPMVSLNYKQMIEIKKTIKNLKLNIRKLDKL